MNLNEKIMISGFADEISDNLNTQVESLKKLGISYVEMRGVNGNNLIYHDDKKVSEIKKILDDNGIKLSSLGSPLGKIGITDAFEPHFDAFKRACEVAHKMECKNIRLFSYYLPENCSPADYENEVFERTSKFVDYAKKNDIILLHENEKGIYGEKAFECKKLMEEFFCDNFKAIFDFANFVQCRQDTIEAYKMLKKYVAYIHVKDAKWENGDVVPAGYGDGNVSAILDDLIKDGYEGFLSLEPHLFNFAGFDSLEKDGKSMKKENPVKLNGFEAFSLAHKSLLKILENI